MLQTLLNITAGTVAVAGSLAEAEQPYELLSATLDGRILMAIVDDQGAAVAIDLSATRPEIISGIAAGAILSDIRDANASENDKTMTVSSGSTTSEVQVDGDIVVGRANAKELSAIIDTLDQLTELQRRQLKTMLGL